MRLRLPHVSCALFMMLCASPSPAVAQERDGFWIACDVGVGSADISAEGTIGSIFDRDRSFIGVSALGVGWA
jgi:hypothetical protein